MDFSITASEVGTLITYVAPGFLMQLGYRAKFPAPERSAGTVLIISLVLSLPLVAIADAVTKLLHISDRPLAVGFALVVTLGAFAIGYLIALIREATWIRKALAFCDYWSQPESSIYAQTLYKIGGAAQVEVRTIDGQHMRGVPTIAPLAQGDGIEELYLSRVKLPPEKEGEEWVEDPNWKSVLLPLSQVSLIALVVDPTPQKEWKSYKDYWSERRARMGQKKQGAGTDQLPSTPATNSAGQEPDADEA